jgi:hypothetical protein
VRTVAATALIVGEGYDEVAFLTHLRQAAGVRGIGVQYTIKNAKGGGAAEVVDQTRRLQQRGGFDRVASLLDTDAGWTAAARKMADDNGIEVFPSSPCLECLLLRAIGVRINDESRVKDQFRPYVNNKPAEAGSYTEHFDIDALISARHSEPTLDALLRFFRV